MSVEIISVHIGKTAGTAFGKVLSQIYSSEQICWDYEPLSYRPDLQALPTSVRTIHGHFPVHKYTDYFPEARRIVWLRHPVFRLISEYFFAKIQKSDNPLHIRLIEENLDLIEFAKQPEAQNAQSEQLQGFSLDQFYFVGLQEFYPEDLLDLQKMMHWSEIETKIYNINPHPTYHESLKEVVQDRELMRKLSLLNSQDMNLYYEALSLRAKRRNESVSLQYSSAGINQIQPLIHQMQVELDNFNFWLHQVGGKTKIAKTVCATKEQVSDKLLGFWIDSPSHATAIEGAYMPIEGWSIGKDQAAVSIRVVYGEHILTETPINRKRLDVAEVHPLPAALSSGFSTILMVAGIPVNAQFLVQVILEDGTNIEIGEIFCL